VIRDAANEDADLVDCPATRLEHGGEHVPVVHHVRVDTMLDFHTV
jgi:hypothetical protein